MRRTGTVAALNPTRGMVGIQTDDDGFTVIEFRSQWDLEVGDEFEWANGYGLGSEVYENISKGTKCEVYVQNHSVSKVNLRQQLLF